MEKENLFQIMNDMHTDVQHPLPVEQAVEYKEVSNICGRLMYEAGQQCRKIRAGKIPWSPSYQKATDMVDYWSRREGYVLGRNKNARYLTTLQKQFGITYKPQLSLQEIVVCKKEAIKSKNRIIKCAESRRREHRTNQVAITKEASALASEVCETQLQELQVWLRSYNTDPSITAFLITGMRSWF